MGQTLTHGIYLPDEGERNCYSGLAANWQILDNSVGTIAANTAALAGKAPAVHTHTKSDITNFPAYGNTAGTICEGNDSRLSDARTPVAHTHTKSDVTDLFNSANTWTNSNTFSLSLYQKGFSPRASAPVSNEFGQYSILDTDGKAIMSTNYANRATGARDLTFRVYNNAGNVNGAGVFKDASDNYSFCSLDPNSTISLGNSANKWKSFNGINPGALSLPNLDTTYRQSVDTTDWVLDGSSSNSFTPSISGWLNIRITDAAGNYIFIQSRSVTVSNQSTGSLPSSVSRSLSSLIPVVAGEPVSVLVQTTSIVGFIYPCLGNV